MSCMLDLYIQTLNIKTLHIFFQTCNVGLTMNELCDNGSDYETVMEKLSDTEKELVSLRCNIQIDASTVICKRHSERYLKMFHLLHKSCCDPFNIHKKKITSKF